MQRLSTMTALQAASFKLTLDRVVIEIIARYLLPPSEAAQVGSSL